MEIYFADGIDGAWPYVLKIRYTTQKSSWNNKKINGRP